MNEALERLRERNRADVELASGVKVTLQLPNLRDSMEAGGVPMPLLEKVERQASSPEGSNGKHGMTTDEVVEWTRFQRVLVTMAVVAVDGEPCELTPDDLTAFEDSEFYEILGYVMRTVPLPGKA